MKNAFIQITLGLLFQNLLTLPVWSQEVLTTKLESYSAVSYNELPILDSLGLPSNTLPSFGRQVDDAIRYTDAIGMLAASLTLYSFEQLQNKKCSFLCSDSLFAWATKLLLFKKGEKQLALTELRYLEQSLTKAGRKLPENEQLIFNKRMKILTEKSRSRGAMNAETSTLIIKNVSSDVLYVYGNSVYLGKVYKDRDFNFEFTPGCHEVSVESPQLKRSGKSWCMRGRQQYVWKVE